MTRRKVERPRQEVRCAIYTRKSTEEGLDQRVNTLDAQRASAEAFIKSQAQEGWVCLSDQFDDGGFTGANMDRPALKRLLSEIEAGNVDCVVAYKIDRFSRNLLDFLKMTEVFDEHNVSFVSVTEQFNTGTPAGRFFRNILLTFGQFEREVISERTRDKIAATRRKGQWTGGMPLLGYDVVDKALVVNQEEAERVRQIFQLYLEMGSLLPVVQDLARRGWTTKPWTTKKGIRRGGMSITKGRLYQLLTNLTFLGKIRYKDEIHEGRHEAIVDRETFELVQAILHENGHSGCGEKRNKHGALLRGILRCSACDCGMTHTYTSKGNRRYRYYVCANAQQNGRKACPAPSIPAEEIERFVVEEIRAIGRDPALVAATLAESRCISDKFIQGLKKERAALERQRRADEADLRRLETAPTKKGYLARSAEVQERMGQADRRRAEVEAEINVLFAQEITEGDVETALAQFDMVWGALAPQEQARAISLLIERVDFDGGVGDLDITFRPTGLTTFAEETRQTEETAA